MMINEVGGKAVGLTGKDGGLIQAQKKLMANKDNPAEPIDIGFVGDITLVEPAVVKRAAGRPVHPGHLPIGYGEDGTAYNINADVVAGKMAEVLGAEKLLMLTNTPACWTRRAAAQPVGPDHRRAVRRRHHLGRHAAQDLVGAGRRQERRELGPHRRRPRAALPAAGNPHGPRRRHDDQLALMPTPRSAARLALLRTGRMLPLPTLRASPRRCCGPEGCSHPKRCALQGRCCGPAKPVRAALSGPNSLSLDGA